MWSDNLVRLPPQLVLYNIEQSAEPRPMVF
jgi:hypothetical protein